MARKKKKKNFDLKREYKESLDYIKETKNFIYSVIAIFLFFVLVGFFLPAPEFLAEQIFEFIEELLEKTSEMSQGDLMSFIFFNNLKSSFLGMVLGLLLGIFPMISVITNGYVLGFVGSLSVKTNGFFVLWRLLPHGIFELPAIFISLGMGLKLGAFIFQKNKIESFREYLWNSLRVFLFVVIPLLVVAAIIEGSLIFIFG